MAEQIRQISQNQQNVAQVIHAQTEQIFKFQDITPLVRQILHLLREMHVRDRDYLDRRSEVLEKLYLLEKDKELSTYATVATKICIIASCLGSAAGSITSLIGCSKFPNKVDEAHLKEWDNYADFFKTLSHGSDSLQHYWELGNDGSRSDCQSKESIYDSRKRHSDEDEKETERKSDSVENDLKQLIDQKAQLVQSMCR